ncbi:putative porin [Paraferrimonas sedimenticola]|uniref:Uncharacterized protein n=1 Tax=Paraferrimonas sedimenticola TaxID=375674 RepID=A0AA37RYI2_9GAMM|nr:putative porin [Paraferrimonas sedimenticola]GLP96967.1 hypothetical protein GCM10007895_22730 [Paraferrimonas sedimenticola]
MPRLVRPKPAAALLLASGLFIPSLVLAEELTSESTDQTDTYQHEVSASLLNASDQTLAAEYRYYLDPVDWNNGPYALNDFLSKTSRIGGALAVPRDDPNNRYAVALEGRYIFDSEWFINAGLGHAKNYSTTNNLYAIGAGKYLNDQTALALNYNRQNIDFGNRSSDDSYDAISLAVQHFRPLSENRGMNFEAAITADRKEYKYRFGERSSQNQVTLSAKGEYFFNQGWRAGVGFYSEFQHAKRDVAMLYTDYQWRVSKNIIISPAIHTEFGQDADNKLKLDLQAKVRF